MFGAVMSLYTPFQLVHAHLSALPSTPGPVVDVSVPSQRAFPEDNEPYTSPLHPEHAISAVLDSRSGILARAIYNGYALELRSLSPVLGRGKSVEDPSVIRVLFPEQLRPLAKKCIIPSFGSGQLIVLVVTEANVIYRLSFALNLFANSGDRIAFMPKEQEWIEEYEVDADLIVSAGEIGSWGVTDQNTVVLGCADGGIIRVVRSSKSSPGESTPALTDDRTTSMVRNSSPRRLQVTLLFARCR